MTDEQIVKAWGKCIDVTSGCCGDDTTCPYCTDEEEGCAKCFEKLRIDVLALIKRQQAEIEKLNKVKVFNFTVSGTKEIIPVLFSHEKEMKNESVKKFAERLTDIICEKIEKSMSNPNGDNYFITDVYTDIDNLVKEMTEKEGGKG